LILIDRLCSDRYKIDDIVKMPATSFHRIPFSEIRFIARFFAPENS